MRTKTKPMSSHMPSEENMDINAYTANSEPISISLASLGVPIAIKTLFAAPKLSNPLTTKTEEDTVTLEAAKRSPMLDFFVTDNGSEEIVSTSTCSANTDSEEMEEDEEDEEIDLMRMAVAVATADNKSTEKELGTNPTQESFLTRSWNKSVQPYLSGPPTFSPFGISAGFYPVNFSSSFSIGHSNKMTVTPGLPLPSMTNMKKKNLVKSCKANSLPADNMASVLSNSILTKEERNGPPSLPSFPNILTYSKAILAANLPSSLPVSISTSYNDLSSGLTNSFANNFGLTKSSVTPTSSTYFEKLAPNFSSLSTSFYNGSSDIMTNTLANNSLLCHSFSGDNLFNCTTHGNLTEHLNMSSTHSSPKLSSPTLLNSTYKFSQRPFGPPAPQAGDTCPEVLAGAAEPLQYLCVLCGREFRFEKNMLRHMQKAHAVGDDESVLKCKLCNYTTKHYSNMYVHIRTHTGDKPYWCSACGASFTQGSSLKLHIKSRHEDDMNFFSLNKKLGKNNLTKLWQRVLKKDIKSMSMMENIEMKSSHNSSMSSLLCPYVGFNPSHSLYTILSQNSPFGCGLQASPQQLMTVTSVPPSSVTIESSHSLQTHTNPITSAAAPLNLKMKSEPELPDPHIALTASWPSFNTATSLPMMLSATNCNMTTPSKIKDERMPVTSCVEQDDLTAEQNLPLNLSPNILQLPHWYCSAIQPFPQIRQEPSITPASTMSNEWQKMMLLNAKMSTTTSCNLVARVDKCFQTDMTIATSPEIDERFLNWENIVLKNQLERLRCNVKKLLFNIYPLDSNVKDEMIGSKVDECLEEAARLLQCHQNRDSKNKV